MFKQTLSDFTLTRINTGETFPSQVPGDITVDLYRAGVIKDPYFGLNHKDNCWVVKEDFDYLSVFSM